MKRTKGVTSLVLVLACVLALLLVGCFGTTEKTEYVISFESNGGSTVAPIVLKEGTTATMPKNPTKEGYVFDGWYLDSALTESFAGTSHGISSNITLYAKWVKAPCEHEFTEWKLGEDYSCVDGGVKTRTCTRCGLTDEMDEPAGHVYEETATVDKRPTCTETGVQSYHCKYCDANTNESELPFAEHAWDEGEELTPASCTVEGEKRATCLECGAKDIVPIAKTPHIPSSAWTVDVEAGCVTSGSKSHHCVECDFKLDVTLIAPVGHDFEGASTCNACGAPSVAVLAEYNGTYGYEYLGTMPKGEALQDLYEEIDVSVQNFHLDTGLNADDDNVVFSVKFDSLGLTQKEAVAVWKTYKDDNPLYYWISTEISYTSSKLNVKTSDEYDEGTERAVYNQLVYDKVEEYTSKIDDGASAYQTTLGFHDLIIKAIDYAYDENDQPETAAWAHNAIGVFEGIGAVCEGYARTFQMLLNYAGIENVVVTGTSRGQNHAWNLVKLDDDAWYWYDLTWDDGANWLWGTSYNYFAVTDQTVNKWSQSQDGSWTTTVEDSFLTSHVYNTPLDEGLSFLYQIPQRSASVYANADDVLLNDTFVVESIEYKVVGYEQLAVISVAKTGEVDIPESVVYEGTTYEVVSLGTVIGKPMSTGVTSINVPKSVIFIWDNVLDSEALKEITVDKNNAHFTSIDGVLYTKSAYTLIKYPSAKTGVKFTTLDETYVVAYSAFRDCTYLQELEIGASVKTVGYGSMGRGYLNSTADEVVPNNFVDGEWISIRSALTGSKKITVDTQNATFKIDNKTLYDADYTHIYLILDNGISTYTFRSSVVTIGQYAFFNCYNLEALVIGDGVESIGKKAFDACFNLSTVTLGRSLATIGDGAFSRCENLKTVLNKSCLNVVRGSSTHGGVAFYATSVQNIL